MRRKFQVSNGYLLETEQLAQVLTLLAERRDAAKVSRHDLMEGTGLSNRQIESLVSIGSAMGLVKRGAQVLTDAGWTVMMHDTFLEQKGTLEWCHYMGAGGFTNLIWYETFNSIFRNSGPLSKDGWTNSLRELLQNQYTEKTLKKHLREEVKFISDAYSVRNFRRLSILSQSSDEKFFVRRYARPEPLVFCSILYHFAVISGRNVLQIRDLVDTPGAPGVVFYIDEAIMCRLAEELHGSGWIRYETTHNLNQIRIKDGYQWLEFLTAHYEGREPRVDSSPGLLRGMSE